MKVLSFGQFPVFSNGFTFHWLASTYKFGARWCYDGTVSGQSHQRDRALTFSCVHLIMSALVDAICSRSIHAVRGIRFMSSNCGSSDRDSVARRSGRHWNSLNPRTWPIISEPGPVVSWYGYLFLSIALQLARFSIAPSFSKAITTLFLRLLGSVLPTGISGHNSKNLYIATKLILGCLKWIRFCDDFRAAWTSR
jgi:hypothetical protein